MFYNHFALDVMIKLYVPGPVSRGKNIKISIAVGVLSDNISFAHPGGKQDFR